MISYIIWNGSPEIFSVWVFSLRYYGILFALGFLITQQILYYIHRQEGKPESDVDTLTVYMIVATIIGARLGHVIFYEPEMLLSDPLGVILPFEIWPFKMTGYTGLASHGGAIAILFALWLYSRKKKPGQNYLQVLDDRISACCEYYKIVCCVNKNDYNIIEDENEIPNIPQQIFIDCLNRTGTLIIIIVENLIKETRSKNKIVDFFNSINVGLFNKAIYCITYIQQF